MKTCNLNVVYLCCTWKDVLNVPGQYPVNESVEQHHEDGNDEGVAVVLLRTDPDVAPLNPDALLFVTGEILTAVSKCNTR